MHPPARIIRVLSITVASIATIVATVGLGCTPGLSEPPASDPVAESTEALTTGSSQAARAGHPAFSEPGRPFGFRGAAAVEAVKNAPQLSAAQHPGHFSDKAMNKPARPSMTGAASPLTGASAASVSSPAVSADKISRQRSYLQQWQDLEPSLASLSQEERDARRAALKKSVLGN